MYKPQESRCDNCLNSRVVISEKGWQVKCCLSVKNAVDCIMRKQDYYAKRR